MAVVDTVTVPRPSVAFAVPGRWDVATPALRGMGCDTEAPGASEPSARAIQRENGVRSATLTTYQVRSDESQRAPKAFTASFSAKGVTRLILMAVIIER